MSGKQNNPKDNTSPTEANDKQSLPGRTANSLSVNTGSCWAMLDLEASVNDIGGNDQQECGQTAREDHHEEEEGSTRTVEHAQLQRWAYETSNSELTPAERLEKQKWGNDGRSPGNKSDQKKRE